MASISSSKGLRTVQFIGPDRKRRSVRLGRASLKTARMVKGQVEHILAANRTRTGLDPETVVWLGDLEDTFYGKLVDVGLVKPREARGDATLGAFIDNYITKRTDLKPGTIVNLKQARRWLVDYFGEDKPLASISQGDADEYRLYLRQHIAENTLRRMCGRARQLFRAAARKRVIVSNPFGEMKGLAVQGKPERYHFVTREDAAKVLDACPDLEWKLIFTFARFGGLRIPSELLGLRWGHVNWERNRLTIISPKTEGHEGQESRLIPLYPELRRLLDEAYFSLGDKAEEFIITRYRGTNQNLRTQLRRIIRKAGLNIWPKLFQNLRSSRQTELIELGFPSHTVCLWQGNSEIIARKHYLQTPDEYYDRAAEAVQNAVQHGSVSVRTGSQGCQVSNGNRATKRDEAKVCEPVRAAVVTPTGTEQFPDSSGKSQVFESRAAECGALTPDLLKVVDAWPSLSTADRAAILTIVDASHSNCPTQKGR